VDLNAAMVTSTHTGPSYLFTSGVYQAPFTTGGKSAPIQNLYTASEFAWLPDSFPIGVAFHRSCCSSRSITAADSVQVMGALNMIQKTLGYTIWHPINDNAAYATDRVSSTTPSRVLIFQYDSSLPAAVAGGGGTGAIAATIGSPQILSLQDFVITGWRNSVVDHLTISNEMSQAQIIGYNPNAGALDTKVLVHEAMHTLGVGHGCSWVSTQSYCGLDPADTIPSFEDAAYLLLAMDVKAATWRHRAQNSLSAALFGDRAIILHTDPVPAPWTLPEPSSLPTANDIRPVVQPKRRPK
jgi:hypothetical protein